MKINSNFYTPYNVSFSRFRCKKEEKSLISDNQDKFSSFPISSYYCVKPYFNSPEFSKYMENKIKKQLMVPTEEDVQNLIDDVVKETKTDEKLVSEVLGRVVQFSSFKQLPQMGKVLDENLVSHIPSNYDQNLNNDFHHVFDTKQMYKLNQKGRYEGFFVDFDNLSRYQYYLRRKASSNDREHPTKLLIVDGWNYRKDCKNKSYTMFGAEDSLKNTVKSIVLDVKKTGKSVDEVLNGEIISEIEKEYGKNLSIVLVKNEALTDFSAKNIAEIMEPYYPKAKEIEAIIDVVLEQDFSDKVNSDLLNQKKFLSDYLDSMIECYSPQRLNVELKKKYEDIERKVKSLGKTMDDVYYIIPNENKSFSLITRQFAKVNDISSEQITTQDGYELFYEGGKVAVLLDDYFGSGESAVRDVFNYGAFMHRISSPIKENNIIFAPIVCTQEAKKGIEETINYLERVGVDFIIPNKVISYRMKDENHLNLSSSRELLGGLGYKDCGSCVAFPTSVPDNNSSFANLVVSRTAKSQDDEFSFISNITRRWKYSTHYRDMVKKIKERVNNENK